MSARAGPSLTNVNDAEAAAPPKVVERPAAELELTKMRLKIFALAAENERLRSTISYQLGAAILRARHWRGALALPGEIAHLILESRRRRGRGSKSNVVLQLEVRKALMHPDTADVPALMAALETQKMTPRGRAGVLAEMAALVRDADPDRWLKLLRAAIDIDPAHPRGVQAAVDLMNAGAIEEPRAILTHIAARRTLPQSAQTRLQMLDGWARVRDAGLAVPPRKARPVHVPAASRSLMYVAASSMPYHTSGYTARTQALLKAIQGQGWAVNAVTRPGYPDDRNDVHHMPDGAPAPIDGVAYARLAGPKSNTTAFDRYCAEASQALYGHIARTRPALVHAASNYLNAAPALIAARRAGLPFVYEVRGLWELTHAAKDPRFEHSERYEWQRQQESRVACEADLVVAISNGLKNELIERGVDERRIMIAPNCVDPDVFAPRKKDRALARELLLGDSKVLGFLGSMTTYEGLIDLVTALSELRGKGHDVTALLVGDGPALSEVREAARSLGVLNHIVMPGRVPHVDVPRWYSLMDIAVYPRRPSKVTELVPPLKPLEAMAMGLTVVASDVAAIKESVIHQESGFLFERGNPASLLSTLEGVMMEPKRAREVARRGRAHVKKLYTWEAAAKRLDDAYSTLSA